MRLVDDQASRPVRCTCPVDKEAELKKVDGVEGVLVLRREATGILTRSLLARGSIMVEGRGFEAQARSRPTYMCQKPRKSSKESKPSMTEMTKEVCRLNKVRWNCEEGGLRGGGALRIVFCVFL